MMSTLLKRLRGAFVIACCALVLITAAGPLATPAHAQAAHIPAQGQPEQPDQPRRPHAGDPTTTPAPPPPLSPETKALRAKLDASKLDLDQKEAALINPCHAHLPVTKISARVRQNRTWAVEGLGPGA